MIIWETSHRKGETVNGLWPNCTVNSGVTWHVKHVHESLKNTTRNNPKHHDIWHQRAAVPHLDTLSCTLYSMLLLPGIISRQHPATGGWAEKDVYSKECQSWSWLGRVPFLCNLISFYTKKTLLQNAPKQTSLPGSQKVGQNIGAWPVRQ